MNEVYSNIYRTYQESSAQQLAYSVIINDVLKSEMMWVDDDGTKLSRIVEVDATWHHFVREFVLNLCLYGFALYRINRRKGGKLYPEVAVGSEVHNIIFFVSSKFALSLIVAWLGLLDVQP